jgi:hypothetical protein
LSPFSLPSEKKVRPEKLKVKLNYIGPDLYFDFHFDSSVLPAFREESDIGEGEVE